MRWAISSAIPEVVQLWCKIWPHLVAFCLGFPVLLATPMDHHHTNLCKWDLYILWVQGLMKVQGPYVGLGNFSHTTIMPDSNSHFWLQEKLKFIVLLWGDASDESRQDLQCPVYSFNDILARGKVGFQSPSIDGDSLATLVYTSGTTGSPKASLFVMRSAPPKSMLKMWPTISVWRLWHRFSCHFQYLHQADTELAWCRPISILQSRSSLLLFLRDPVADRWRNHDGVVMIDRFPRRGGSV